MKHFLPLYMSPGKKWFGIPVITILVLVLVLAAGSLFALGMVIAFGQLL